jgi:feruloyl esterase
MASGRVALIPLALLWLVPTVAAAVTCEALRFSAPVGTEIVTAATVPARPAQVQVAPGEPARALELPAHCRIAGVIRPTSASHIRFELWMPVRGWTGRFEGVGNGNYAGMLSAGALPYGIIRGSAIATTDTGHESTPADPRTAHWAGSRERSSTSATAKSTLPRASPRRSSAHSMAPRHATPTSFRARTAVVKD